MKGKSFGILLRVVGATCASTRVVADDPLGSHVGLEAVPDAARERIACVCHGNAAVPAAVQARQPMTPVPADRPPLPFSRQYRRT